MSKQTVRFRCGHELEVAIRPYKGETEEHWLQRQEGNLCPECYREAKWQEEIAAAKKAAKTENFPELEGTEKQIDYAYVIRSKKNATIEESLAMIGLSGEEAACFDDWLFWDGKHANQAKFWIDNKNKSIKYLYELYLAQKENKTEKNISKDDYKEFHEVMKGLKGNFYRLPELTEIDQRDLVLANNKRMNAQFLFFDNLAEQAFSDNLATVKDLKEIYEIEFLQTTKMSHWLYDWHIEDAIAAFRRRKENNKI